MLGFIQAFSFVGCIGFATSVLNENKAFATGLVLSMGLLGAVISQAPFSILLSLFGWRVAVIVIALIGLLFFLYNYFSLQS